MQDETYEWMCDICGDRHVANPQDVCKHCNPLLALVRWPTSDITKARAIHQMMLDVRYEAREEELHDVAHVFWIAMEHDTPFNVRTMLVDAVDDQGAPRMVRRLGRAIKQFEDVRIERGVERGMEHGMALYRRDHGMTP